MSEELTLSDEWTYSKNGVEKTYSQSGETVDISGDTAVDIVMLIATTDTVIDLGTLTTLGWARFKNLDTVNYIDIKIAAAGTIWARLHPGKIAKLYLGSGITAPVAIANTAACKLHCVILPP